MPYRSAFGRFFLVARFVALTLQSTVIFGIVCGLLSLALLLWVATVVGDSAAQSQISRDVAYSGITLLGCNILLSLLSSNTDGSNLDAFGVVAASATILVQKFPGANVPRIDTITNTWNPVDQLLGILHACLLVFTIESLLFCRSSEATFVLSQFLRTHAGKQAARTVTNAPPGSPTPTGGSELDMQRQPTLDAEQEVASPNPAPTVRRRNSKKKSASSERDHIPVVTQSAVARRAIIFVLRWLAGLFLILPKILDIMVVFLEVSHRSSLLIQTFVFVVCCLCLFWYMMHSRFAKLLVEPMQRLTQMIDNLIANPAQQGRRKSILKRPDGLNSPTAHGTEPDTDPLSVLAQHGPIGRRLSKMWAGPAVFDEENPPGCAARIKTWFQFNRASVQPALPVDFMQRELFPTAESELLRRYLRRMWRLVQLGFGEAGETIIARYLNRAGLGAQSGLGLDALDLGTEAVISRRISMKGEKIHAIFMFCDIRGFTDISEHLQEDVLSFVNHIAAIVHTEVASAGGVPNKNIGDAFLLTWKLPDAPLENTVKSRRRGALEQHRMNHALSQQNKTLATASPNNKQRLTSHGSRQSVTAWIAKSSLAIDVLLQPDAETRLAKKSSKFSLNSASIKSTASLSRHSDALASSRRGRGSVPDVQISSRLLHRGDEIASARRGSEVLTARLGAGQHDSQSSNKALANTDLTGLTGLHKSHSSHKLHMFRQQIGKAPFQVSVHSISQAGSRVYSLMDIGSAMGSQEFSHTVVNVDVAGLSQPSIAQAADLTVPDRPSLVLEDVLPGSIGVMEAQEAASAQTPLRVPLDSAVSTSAQMRTLTANAPPKHPSLIIPSPCGTSDDALLTGQAHGIDTDLSDGEPEAQPMRTPRFQLPPGITSLRRSSSRASTTGPDNNPYRQRQGIQIFADNALAAALNVLIRLHIESAPSGRLAHFQRKLRAAACTNGFQLGFGLHIGYAIEGPIGSHFKIDASYLSPAVNTTSRLESATRLYKVDIIVSHSVGATMRMQVAHFMCHVIVRCSSLNACQSLHRTC
jgi:class 3 adenylate cyclase